MPIFSTFIRVWCKPHVMYINYGIFNKDKYVTEDIVFQDSWRDNLDRLRLSIAIIQI